MLFQQPQDDGCHRRNQHKQVSCPGPGLAPQEDDTLVRDYVPIKIGSEGCLYDKVSQTVFHTAGEGAFGCGPDFAETVLWKKPLYDAQVEYLESTGTQYIDTGIVPEVDDRILTLSTCTGQGYDTRWVVQAVLV